jgi:hypothetical protein
MKKPIEEKNKNKMEWNKNNSAGACCQPMASGTSDPKSTVRDRIGLKLGSMSMQEILLTTSPQIHTTNDRPVRCKNSFDSTSTADQDLGFADNITHSTIWTPDESCLSSDESSPDLTAEPGYSIMKPQDFDDALRLAFVRILKDFADALSK